MCRKHQHEIKDSENYKIWRAKHESTCQINYKGLSGGMEVACTVKIFKRSIESRGSKYTTFVGDRDSDTFKVVHEEVLKTYIPLYEIVKKECIGHIHKGMGNALRTLLKDMKEKKCLTTKL